MIMKHITSYLTAAALMLISMTAGAQALPFVAADYNAESLGKASANVVETGSTAYAAFTNPASIVFSESTLDAAASYTLWAPTNSNVITAGGSFKLGMLGVAAGFSYGMNPAYDITDANGMTTGTFSPADMQVGAGVSYRLLKVLSLGANVSYATSKLAEGYSYGAVSADVFAMASLAGLKVAAGISNIGTSVKSASGEKFSLPTSVTLGAGYGLSLGNHGVELSLDADYFLDGGLAAAVGAEYAMKDMVFVRAGYRYSNNAPMPSFASVGAGVKFIGIKLDVAYVLGSDTIGNTLAVGLGYSF